MVYKKNIHIFKEINGSGLFGIINGGDFLSWIQDKINPGEMHIPGYQYCGPFTKYKQRLERGDPGINIVDKACKKHDNKYNETKDAKLRHIADQELLDDLDAIENPTNVIYPLGERQARAIIKPIIKAKKLFGLGLSKTNIYCVKCKSHTKTKDIKETVTKNNRPILKGICMQCGSKKNRFLGQIINRKVTPLKKKSPKAAGFHPRKNIL
ncbi:hypothetical protein AVEN_180971-1 [Araneus ventricosus]|uniref:Uncharacterized protein n=1 Tax=Araneus ventricosus TaxID=182803 RepID=A0A4Y2FQI2_ARAVE|nr:hypothetical protein AVEN_180971-1 [Araneus ventricosus]